MHYAAGYGHEECVERLLEKEFDPVVQDHNGDTALHLAATHGCPMSAFNLTKAAPVTCLTENQKQQRPADVAKACERGEVASLASPTLQALEDNVLLKPQQCACRLQVLNAMLLACSGDATAVAVEAMRYLLKEGAVPDTWAPNGSSVSHLSAHFTTAFRLSACCSEVGKTPLLRACLYLLQALMLAASVDGVAAIKLLLKHGATIELQVRGVLLSVLGACKSQTCKYGVSKSASIRQAALLLQCQQWTRPAMDTACPLPYC